MSGPRRTVQVGLIVFVCAIVLMFMPLLLGHSSLNRFIVAAGFIGACAGAGMMLNGAVDMWRR